MGSQLQSPRVLLLLATLLLLGGCRVEDAADEPAQTPAGEPSAGEQPLPRQPPVEPHPDGELRLEVSLAERELYVLLGGRRVETHAVAIGRQDWPTPTGEFRIHQVDWNPRWVPPDSEWAAGEPIREPGDPENPMGRARLVFHETYSIHGTDDSESLGRAASHGSIRVGNDVVEQLGRRVMEHGGAERPDAFYRQVREERNRMQQVTLPQPVPITIRD